MSGKTAKMHRRMSRIMHGGSVRYTKDLRRAWDSMTEAERKISGEQIRRAIEENNREHLVLSMRKGVAFDAGAKRF